MEQPLGFFYQGESGLVCKLHRSLYGLKQSSRAWFGKFNYIVQSFGLECSKVDHCIFYCHTALESVYLIVYVDDIVIIGNDVVKICQLKRHLCKHFKTKDLGNLKYFSRHRGSPMKGRSCCLRKYALDILKETCMVDC